ncbi:MAG: hypothetical protein GY953_00280 [bacterium]|nr:hypothetical protein [bacterium]
MIADAEKSQFRAGLERVLSSDAIRHSTGLRRLLSFLAEQSLAGSAGDLKEYTIGLEAFGKPPDYDPQQDPAVRVLASKLRHKLEEYYLKEGADDPVRIELPKGHYELKFRTHSDRVSSPEVGALRSEVRRWRRMSLALAICTAVLASLGGYWWLSPWSVTEATAGPQWTPELESIWRPYIESERPTLVALGAPLFTKFSGGFFRSPRINEREAAAASPHRTADERSL